MRHSTSRAHAKSCRGRLRLNPILNQNGYTLAEVVVAAALMLSTAGSVSYFISNTAKTKVASAGTACLLHVNQVMSRISQEGLTRDALEPLDNGASPLNVLASPNGIQRTTLQANEQLLGIVDAHRLFSGSEPVLLEPTAGNPIVRNAHLLQGSVSSVQAIYNQHRGSGNTICTTGVDYDDAAIPAAQKLFPDGTSNEKWQGDGRPDVPVTTLIQIDTYDLTTGTNTCEDDVPIILRPKPIAEPSEAEADAQIDFPNHDGMASAPGPGPVAGPPFFRSDLGFVVTVRANYTEQDDERGALNKSCEVTQRFQHTRDATDPPQALAGVHAYNPAPAPTVLNCGFTPSTYSQTHNITVAFNATSTGSGAVMLCRDQSRRRLPISANSQNYPVGGSTANIVTPLCVGNDHVSAYTTNPSYPGVYLGNDECFVARDPNPNYYPDTDADFGMAPQNQWLPCHQISICNAQTGGGVVPTTASFVKNGNNFEYQLDFALNNNHLGCDIIIDYVLVDPAGNLGPVQTFSRALHVQGAGAGNEEPEAGTPGVVCLDQFNHYFAADSGGGPANLDGTIAQGTYFWNCSDSGPTPTPANSCPVGSPNPTAGTRAYMSFFNAAPPADAANPPSCAQAGGNIVGSNCVTNIPECKNVTVGGVETWWKQMAENSGMSGCQDGPPGAVCGSASSGRIFTPFCTGGFGP